MSVMNILSDAGPPPEAVSVASPPLMRQPSKSIDGSQAKIKAEVAPSTPMQEISAPNGHHPQRSEPKGDRNGDAGDHPTMEPPSYPLPITNGPPGLTVRATEEAYAEIEAQALSDVEAPGFEAPFSEWKSRIQKRHVDISAKESSKRKVHLSSFSYEQ